MWNKNKLIKMLRYYSILSIIMCLFLLIAVNKYFPPLKVLTGTTINYLEEQRNIEKKEDKQKELTELIQYQKIISKHDEYTSNLKFHVMSLSIVLLFVSILVYILTTKQLKLNTKNIT